MKFMLFLSPILLMILGIIISKGKGSFLIAGYNTSPKELKEKYDEKELCKFIGRLLLYLACIQFVPVSAEILDFSCFEEILIATNIATIFIAISSIIHLNTSKKFKNNKDEKED